MTSAAVISRHGLWARPLRSGTSVSTRQERAFSPARDGAGLLALRPPKQNPSQTENTAVRDEAFCLGRRERDRRDSSRQFVLPRVRRLLAMHLRTVRLPQPLSFGPTLVWPSSGR